MMKRLIAAVFVGSLCTAAYADVGFLAGLTYAFGSNAGPGITVQATSTRKQDRGFVAAGLSYYPFASKPTIGFPVGIGYQKHNWGASANYDFGVQDFSLSAGYADTKTN
jgi:hypothetical protein